MGSKFQGGDPLSDSLEKTPMISRRCESENKVREIRHTSEHEDTYADVNVE